MNYLSNLRPADGSVKKSKRIGRGQGSGKGGTSTKGHKGAQARTGYSVKAGFEGGQMPLQRRLPKYGFKNPFRVEYKAINLSDLQALMEKHSITDFNVSVFKSHGMAQKNDLIKVLAKGEIKASINVTVNAISSKAKELIEAAGGSVSIIEKHAAKAE